MSLDRVRSLPCWSGEVTAEPLTGGLSNESWLVRDGTGRHVARFGHDYPFHHVSRDREVMVARAAHAAGFAPRVEYSANGVMVSAFVEAVTWGPDTMRAGAGALGALLARFHREMPARISGPAFLFDAFHVIRDYARTLGGGDGKWAGRVRRLVDLGADLEAVQVPLPIIFGHHDMLPANVLQTGDRLWLIDFEYAGFGTAMFDLASSASNARMSDDEALTLVEAYLGHEPGPAFMQAFEAMRCAALVREAMWAMVSDAHLTTPGVDFAAYAQDNLTALDALVDRYQSRYGKIAQ